MELLSIRIGVLGAVARAELAAIRLVFIVVLERLVLPAPASPITATSLALGLMMIRVPNLLRCCLWAPRVRWVLGLMAETTWLGVAPWVTCYCLLALLEFLVGLMLRLVINVSSVRVLVGPLFVLDSSVRLLGLLRLLRRVVLRVVSRVRVLFISVSISLAWVVLLL